MKNNILTLFYLIFSITYVSAQCTFGTAGAAVEINTLPGSSAAISITEACAGSTLDITGINSADIDQGLFLVGANDGTFGPPVDPVAFPDVIAVPGYDIDVVSPSGNYYFGTEYTAAVGDGDGTISGTLVNATCASEDQTFTIIPILDIYEFDGATMLGSYLTTLVGDPAAEADCAVAPLTGTVTVYPLLTATVVDNGATCGTAQIDLVAADGMTVCASETLVCAADGDVLNPDFSIAFPDPLGCSALTAMATCANCAGPAVCASVAEPSPAYACAGSDFEVSVDMGGCTVDPFWDDAAAGEVSGYLAFYYFDGTGFANCPPGTNGAFVLDNPGDIAAGTPGFVFYGETNAANGAVCSNLSIGAFINPTCGPVDIPICLINGEVNNFFVAADTNGDGYNDYSCQAIETTVTIYPNIETEVVADMGCVNGAFALVSAGVDADGNPVYYDLDGDGAITAADACDSALLGGDPDDCTDGATLDYDFTPAYVTGDANYPGGCVEPATGTLTCVCAGVCTASSGSALVDTELCEGVNFTVTLNGCTAGDQSGYILAYDFDPSTVPTQAELYDGLIGGPTDPGDIGFFGEYSDCMDDAFTDLIGFTLPGCDAASIDIYIVPSSDAFIVDPNCAPEGPLTITYYPTLTATVTADDSAACGDVTVELQTILESDGSTVVCDSQTQSCVANDDILTFDFSGSFTDPLMCSTLSATATACAGCGGDEPEITITDPCDCASADNIDLDGDGAIDLVADEITITGPPGDTWCISANPMPAAQDMAGTDLAVDGSVCAVEGPDGVYTLTIYHPADGTGYGPLTFSSGSGLPDQSIGNADGCDCQVACEIAVEIILIDCDQNGTPEDPTDDIGTYDIVIAGTNTSGSYDVGVVWNDASTGGSVTGTSTTTITVTTPAVTDGSQLGSFSVTVSDADGSGCMGEIPGNFVGCATPAIPTLSQWGLMILALLMMTFGALKIGSVRLSSVRKN